MRLHSTPQSALAGEVTVLAVFETVAATAISIWWIIHRGTLTHVAVSACVAPFLLLRTDESTEFAFRYAARVDDWATDMKAGFIIGVLGMPTIRPLSIARAAIRAPLSAVRSIPQNWSRTVLATDICHPPELLPEIETRGESKRPDLRFSRFVGGFKQHEWKEWDTVIMVILAAILWFVPALLYRYSLKATAIVYLPILWILHDSLVDASTLKQKLEDISTSPLEKLKRWYSGFVIIFLLLIPTAIYFSVSNWWNDLSGWLRHEPRAVIALLSTFLPATPTGLHIEAWHLARGINAVLTLVLLQWTYTKMRQMERGTLIKPDVSVATLNVWLLIRGMLTLYVIGCTLFIIIAAVTWKDLWPVHIRWFPWK